MVVPSFRIHIKNSLLAGKKGESEEEFEEEKYNKSERMSAENVSGEGDSSSSRSGQSWNRTESCMSVFLCRLRFCMYVVSAFTHFLC